MKGAMRIGIVALAVLLEACGGGPRADPCQEVAGYCRVCGDGVLENDEECDPPAPGVCTSACTLPYVDVTVHWSFETLSGDAKASCLPGDPDVRLDYVMLFNGMQSASQQLTEPCASGQASLQLKLGGAEVSVSSVADHAYDGGLSFEVPPAATPTVVVYTDAGEIDLDWQVNMGESTCEEAGIETVRVLLDGAQVKETACDDLGLAGIAIGPFPAGTHSVRADGLDHAGNIIATSAPVDVNFLGGATVKAQVDLELQP